MLPIDIPICHHGVAGLTEKQAIHFKDRQQNHIYDKAIKV
jgi:hypothetical protein